MKRKKHKKEKGNPTNFNKFVCGGLRGKQPRKGW